MGTDYYLEARRNERFLHIQEKFLKLSLEEKCEFIGAIGILNKYFLFNDVAYMESDNLSLGGLLKVWLVNEIKEDLLKKYKEYM